jgi:hypothetical protein
MGSGDDEAVIDREATQIVSQTKSGTIPTRKISDQEQEQELTNSVKTRFPAILWSAPGFK